MAECNSLTCPNITGTGSTMQTQLLYAAKAALILAACACASPSPFTWEAIEGLEQASSALPARASRIVEVTGRFLPAQTTLDNACAAQTERTSSETSGPTFWLLLPVLTAIVFYLLGWSHGVHQSTSMHAMREAARQDQLKQQATAAEVVEAEAMGKLPIALATLEPPARSEQTLDNTAETTSLSSADSSCEQLQSNEVDPAADTAGAAETSSSSSSSIDPCQAPLRYTVQPQVSKTALFLTSMLFANMRWQAAARCMKIERMCGCVSNHLRCIFPFLSCVTNSRYMCRRLHYAVCN